MDHHNPSSRPSAGAGSPGSGMPALPETPDREQKSLRQWSLPRLLIFVGVTVFALIALTHIVLAALAVPTVPVALVERRPLLHTIVSTGRVYAPETIAVDALIRGTVAELNVIEGDTVEAGSMLVRLRNQEATATVAEAIARVAEAEAQLARIKTYEAPLAQRHLERADADLEKVLADFHRAETLAADSIISSVEFETAAQQLTAAREQRASAALRVEVTEATGSETLLAESAIAAARAALATAEVRASYTRINAPRRGIILHRTIAHGDAVESGEQLLTLLPLEPAQLLIQLDERALSVVEPGQRAVAVADGFPTRSFDAVVDRIAPSVDLERGTIAVRLQVPAPPPFLRPDMTISVTIEAQQSSEGFAVPSQAIRMESAPIERGSFVFVVRDGLVEQIPVDVGLRGSTRFEVLGALQEGDQVIVTDADPPPAGSHVRVRAWNQAEEDTNTGSGLPFH